MNKKDVLKFLGRIGVDTRFISLYEYEVYINNLRFSKFSKKKEEIFMNKFPEVNVLRSTLFQRTAAKASKSLSHSINVKDNILIFNHIKRDILSNILLEPYLRKYGVKFIDSKFKSYQDLIKSKKTSEFLKDNNIDCVVSSISMDEEVNSILSAILSGKGLKSYPQYLNSENDFKIKILYPFMNNIDSETIETLCEVLKINGEDENVHKSNELTKEFMNFLDDLVPYSKENILKSANFLNNH
ncbi:MAG: hypothetical protein LBR15_02665 [Methanobrevibacter sp.]|jgi:hypothetical protein|nr:hypothetical protein [Candidatus Methanovirga australis]